VTHELLRREKNITNTVECNCLITLIIDGFQRIGYENLYQCPVEISLWYRDYRGTPCLWSNRSKNARELKGDFTCRNAEYLLFCYFNPSLMVPWSPMKYLGENELCRNWVSFISEMQPNNFIPAWQLFLESEAVQCALVLLTDRFLLLLGECGDSITADEPHMNNTLGLVSIRDLMAEDTHFQRSLCLHDDEREHITKVSSTFTRDFRSAPNQTRSKDKAAAPHKLWILQHGRND
jgi:hypothetical protein